MRKLLLVFFALISVNLFAATPSLITLTAGKNPEGIAVNPVTHKAYVVAEVDNPDQQVVMVFNGAALLAGQPIPPPKLIPITDESEYIAVDTMRNRIYLSTRYGIESSDDESGGDEGGVDSAITTINKGTLTVIDGKTDTVIAIYQFPEGIEPEGVAIDRQRNIVYVATKAPEPEPAGGTCPWGTWFIDEDGDEECWTSGTIYVFNGALFTKPDFQPIKTIAAGDDPESIVFANNMLYAANEDDGTITIARAVKADGSGGELVTDPPAYSSALPPYSLGVFHGFGPNTLACPDKRYEADKMVQAGLGPGLIDPIYITDDKSRVALIMGSEVVNSTEITGASQCDLAMGNDENGLNTANNIAFMKRSSGSRVYVVSEQNTVAILDPQTLQRKATITVPNAVHLDAIGVDGPANLVWITDEQLMQVFVLRGTCASGTGSCVMY